MTAVSLGVRVRRQQRMLRRVTSCDRHGFSERCLLKEKKKNCKKKKIIVVITDICCHG